MAKRNGSQGGALDPALSQKKRARRRLIGAAALALLAAIVLPLLLDPEPRQAPGEVQVEIPSRDTPLASLSAPPRRPADAESASPAPTPDSSSQPTPADSAPASRAVATVSPLPAPAAASRADSPRPAPSAKSPAERPPEPARSDRSPADRSQSERSQPAGESTGQKGTTPGSPPPAVPTPAQPADRRADDAAGRYVIQIGAYANADSARTMADRARKAGVRAYTEPVNTSAGVRTRVRVGPFAEREAAERARGRLTLVGIESTVVTLP